MRVRIAVCYKISIISFTTLTISRIFSYNYKCKAHEAKNSINGGKKTVSMGEKKQYKWRNIRHPWKPSQSVNPKTLRKSNDLLAVLHTSLHAHRVSLWARGPIALAWVSRALLGPWRRPLMGLLGVRPTWPIRLTAHFPHLIHGAWSLWNESDKEVWAKVTHR